MSIGQDEREAPILCAVEKWVGAHEIAALLGVSRQRVQQLATRPDFPEPMVRLKGGAVWVTADVVEWARSRGRDLPGLEEPEN